MVFFKLTSIADILTVEDDQAHKKQKLNPPEWEQDKPIIYSVDNGKMFFVNRSHALEQLHKIHKAKYERASAFGEGENWIIPLADNVNQNEFSKNSVCLSYYSYYLPERSIAGRPF